MVDWCLDRPYKCPRLLGFILSFPITLVEQASLAELHLVNRNLKTPINSRLTSNVKKHIPTQNKSQTAKKRFHDKAISHWITVSLLHMTIQRWEGTFNSRQWNDGIALDWRDVEEGYYNIIMWTNQVVEKHMLAILASSYTQSLEAFLPLTTLKSSRESRKLPCFVFILISHIVILHKSDVKWWTKLQHAYANCLKLQSPIRSRGVSETCGGDCFSHHGLQKAPKKLANQSPTSSFHGKSSSHRWWCSMKKWSPSKSMLLCFCMFFPSLLTKNVQDLRDSQPTNQLNQPNPRRPQAAATSASSASQKHEVHPSQRTVNEPWNGGTVDPGKKGSRDTRRIFHTHWYTFSLRIQNISRIWSIWKFVSCWFKQNTKTNNSPIMSY